VTKVTKVVSGVRCPVSGIRKQVACCCFPLCRYVVTSLRPFCPSPAARRPSPFSVMPLRHYVATSFLPVALCSVLWALRSAPRTPYLAPFFTSYLLTF